MNKILPQLLREYCFQLIHPGVPLKYYKKFLVVQEGFEVLIKERS
jgi:hypothetical protein